MTEFFCIAAGFCLSTSGKRNGANPVDVSYKGVVETKTAEDAYDAVIDEIAKQNNVDASAVTIDNFNCMPNNP